MTRTSNKRSRMSPEEDRTTNNIGTTAVSQQALLSQAPKDATVVDDVVRPEADKSVDVRGPPAIQGDPTHPRSKPDAITISRAKLIKETDVELHLNITPYRVMLPEKVLTMYPDQPLLYRQRFYEDGIYQHLYKKILDAKFSEQSRPKMLATAELNRDFKTVRGNANSVVCARDNGSIAIFTCFGEIATNLQGTRLSAKGNHYSGSTAEDFKFIRDGSKVKNVLMLRAPTIAPHAIKQLFMKQVFLLEQAMASMETLIGEGTESFPATRSTEGKEGRINAIALSTPYIYTVPHGGLQDPRVVRQIGGEEEDGTNASIIYPSGALIRPNALYEPTLLPDFGGKYFEFRKSKLVQQNFYDMENKLIPPWDAYNKLRPGTMVAANVSFDCFVSTEDKKKSYRVKMDKLSIIAESPEIPEPRSIPSVPLSVQVKDGVVEEPDDLDAFRPSKKQKLNDN